MPHVEFITVSLTLFVCLTTAQTATSSPNELLQKLEKKLSDTEKELTMERLLRQSLENYMSSAIDTLEKEKHACYDKLAKLKKNETTIGGRTSSRIPATQPTKVVTQPSTTVIKPQNKLRYELRNVYIVSSGFQFNGATSQMIITNPPIDLVRRNSFAVYARLRIEKDPWHWTQYILSKWENPWVFRFYLENGRICVDLRRNAILGVFVVKDVHLVNLCDCILDQRQELDIGFTWDPKSGLLAIYQDGQECSRKQSMYRNEELQRNNDASWEVGFKGDTNDSFLKGHLKKLCIAPGTEAPNEKSTCKGYGI